jgi:hypothetical protein
VPNDSEKKHVPRRRMKATLQDVGDYAVASTFSGKTYEIKIDFSSTFAEGLCQFIQQAF